MVYSMPYFWSRFRRERFFLTSYFGLQALVLAIAACLLYGFQIHIPEPPRLVVAALLPIALYAGLKLPTIMHNAVHGNLTTANGLVGEVTAFFILVSFGIVCLLHTLHHRYPDTRRDPHNPAGRSFAGYLVGSQFRGMAAARAAFLGYHGAQLSNQRLFGLNIALHLLSYALRLAILALVLRSLFLELYLPAFAAYLFVFAHVNYTTHQTDADGQPAILDLNTTLFCRTVNWLCDGIYFHRSHHRHPGAYNPGLPRRSLP